MDGLTKHDRYRLKDLAGYRAKKAAWARQPEQREKRRLYMIEWREKNREKHNQAHREYHAKNRATVNERQKLHFMKAKYGLSIEDYNAMVLAQSGLCKLCRRKPLPQKRRGLHIDHSHKTGRIRGLLCVSCNTTLGKIEAIGIRKFEEYIGLGWDNKFKEGVYYAEEVTYEKINQEASH